MNHATSGRASTRRGTGRSLETTGTGALVFPYETDLEDYVESCLPRLLGQDLLIIGRQVLRLIDLLAIDADGGIHVIELKRHEAKHKIIRQVLRYRRSIMQMNREEIIRHVANGDHPIDLVDAFERHFGRPLPQTVNESVAVMIIAASIHRETADCILSHLEEGYRLTTFRYVVEADEVSLIPCCRDAQDVQDGLHLAVTSRVPRSTRVEQTHHQPTRRGPVDWDIRRFWSTQAEYFADIVRLSSIYEHYKVWVRAHQDEGVVLLQIGLFSKQLIALAAESREWRPVYVRGTGIGAAETPASPQSVKTTRGLGDVRAFQRIPRQKPYRDHSVLSPWNPDAVAAVPSPRNSHPGHVGEVVPETAQSASDSSTSLVLRL